MYDMLMCIERVSFVENASDAEHGKYGLWKDLRWAVLSLCLHKGV